jgi:hypothetical protein
MMDTNQITEEQGSPRVAGEIERDIAAVRSKVTTLEQQARTLIRQRPVVAVLAAAGAGYLVARFVSHGMRRVR